jgi:hypothetical protein
MRSAQQSLRELICEYHTGKPDHDRIGKLTDTIAKRLETGNPKLRASVADGYFTDGQSRPWRFVRISSLHGTLVWFTYEDNGCSGICPVYSIDVAE